MTQLIILGSANAIATEGHENTHMVLVGRSRTIMIDCVSSPLIRLRTAGVAFDQVTDLILTHFHPDHVSGVPLMLMDMWLLGRRQELRVHGLSHTLERIQSLMDLYGWKSWPDFYPVSFHTVPGRELAKVVEGEEFRVLSSPVHHLIPTIGLRIESTSSSHVIAYSCDTEPCDEVARLAAGADVLIHEAAGAGRGHSSAAEAAGVARQAEVGRLILIHYPSGAGESDDLVRAARDNFQGDVELAQDLLKVRLD